MDVSSIRLSHALVRILPTFITQGETMSKPARINAMSAEYESAKKSQVVTWVLWVFTGGIGGHRYYLGDIGFAVAMTLVNWMTFGIWGLVDAFFINRRLRLKIRDIYKQTAYRYCVNLYSGIPTNQPVQSPYY